MNTVSWSLCWIVGTAAGLWLAGRAEGGLEPVYGQAMLLLALACTLPAAISWRDRQTRWAALLLMALTGSCGAGLLTNPPVTPADIAYYNTQASGPPLLIIGTMRNEPVSTDRSLRVRVSAEQVRLPGETIPDEVKGDLLAILPRYPEFDVGTRLVLSGTLTAPPNLSSFDYAAYLARQGIRSYTTFPAVKTLSQTDYSFMEALVSKVRPGVKAALQRAIPEPEAALTVGVVTGDRTQIADDIQISFRRSGIIHILAISGQNIAIMIGTVWLFFGASQRRMTVLTFFIATLLIVIYTLFTGATPAVVRAAVMGAILLLAPLVNRRFDPIAALALAATVMLMVDPDLLLDVGFQLSCAAMLGISLLASPLFALTRRIRIPKVLGLPVSVSIAAQATTLPLIALYFGQVSTVALPVTLITAVALPPLMITGIAAGVCGAIFAPLAVPFGLLAWPFAAWIIWWAQAWAALPWSSLGTDNLNPIWMVAYYAFLGAIIWLVKQHKQGSLAKRDYAVALLASTAIALWSVFLSMIIA